MDNHSVKRSLDGVVVPRRSSGVILRTATDNKEQFCNRIGCKGRLSHTKLSQSGCSGKYKSLKSLPLNASNRMEVIGSSTGNRSVICGKNRKFVEQSPTTPRYLKKIETNKSETTSSSIHEDERHASMIGKAGVVESGNSKGVLLPNTSSNNRKKLSEKNSGIATQSTFLVTSKSKINNQRTRSSPANTSRYGLRNLGCNSISDVLSSGGSSSFDSKNSKRKDLVKKKNSEVESSSSKNRGKKQFSEDRGYSTLNHGVYKSDSRRRGSIETQRPVSGNNTRRRRFPNGRNRMDIHFTENCFSAEASSSSSTRSTRPGSSGCSVADTLPIGHRELGIPNPLLNLEGLRRHNIDGIAEALLALERIEHDEELTYEQLMALDANLFLGGLGFFDQHREMRLDIDNMSYEELLALEEKMGSVSTALSEEVISKSLRSSIFQPKALGAGNIIGSKGDQNEVKCCICQEEYKEEDEVGRLKCEHGYHMECICQWLRLKNWCPICKAPAATLP